jgi:hypothetical protein
MIEDMKELLRKEPFIAFKIVMTSGHSYDVTTPYQVAMGQTQLDYYYPRSDCKAFLRMNQIAAVETLEETTR